jgi:hypothetical protein
MALRICCPSCNLTGTLPEQYRGEALVCPGCKIRFQVIRSNPAPAGVREADATGPSRSWLMWRAIAVIGVVGLGLATGKLVFAGLALFSPHHEEATAAAGPKAADPPTRVDLPRPADPPQPAEPPKEVWLHEPDAQARVPAPPDVPQPPDPPIEAELPKAADPPKGAKPPKPVDNLRVTREAFDKIEWQMSRQDIESILASEGEKVDNSLIIRAMGAEPGDKREPYKRVEQGLWLKWQGDDQTTLFVQFGGPNLVQKLDGSFSVGPNTECSMILFMTEKPRPTNAEIRDIHIYWRLGTSSGEIRGSRS